MSKLWLVARHEYKRHVQKRSFLFALLSVPLVMVVVIGIALLLRPSGESRVVTVGYVDQAGLLAGPAPEPGVGEDVTVYLIPFRTEEAAGAALSAEEVQAYFVLPTDYEETQQVEVVAAGEPDAAAIRSFQDLLRARLLTGQPEEIVQRAIAGSERVVRSPDGRELSGGISFGQLLPAFAALALVVLILFSSSYLVQAVVDEKANRTMEILVTSASAGQLVSGKVLGIVAIGFTQLFVWLAFGVVAIWGGGRYLGLEWLQDVRVDPSTILITAALVILAYLFVAALLMAIGATLVEPRAGQQVTMVFIAFYMVPLGFIGPMLADLSGPLAVGLSLFPLTSPVVLPLRAGLGLLPSWQAAASIGIQCLCALGALWLAGRAVRLGMLRYGQPLGLGALFGRGQARPRRGAPRGRAPSVAEEQVRGSRRPTRSKTLLVLRHELRTIITQPYFLALLFGLPLLVFGQIMVFDLIQPDSQPVRVEPAGIETSVDITIGPAFEVQGYVDHSGLIQTIPDEEPEGALVGYADEPQARQALEAGEIGAYYVIPADYVTTGELIYIHPQYSPLSRANAPALIDWVLLVNLLGGNEDLAAEVWSPADLQLTAPTGGADSGAEPDEGSIMERLLPMLIMLLLYAAILTSSGLLVRSVSEEKKNRVMEVLLVSVNAEQLLTGKIAALGVAGLIQTAGWGGLGYLLYVLKEGSFSPATGVAIPLSALIWGTVFLILGYAIYASLMAGAGALMPNWKETPQATFVLALPALIGFMIMSFQIESPHGLLAVIVSLFPLTAPFAMIRRLLAGGVPTWQLLLSVGLMVLAVYLLTRAVARMFHAQNLLSGQPFSLGRYLRVLTGRS